MTRKILALLMAAMLCLGCVCGALAEAAPVAADDGWYLDTAVTLADKMSALANSQAYVELFIGLEVDTDTFVAQMNALSGLEPSEIITYLYKTDALENLAKAYQMDEVTTALSKPAMEAVYRRMNNSLGSLLNGYVGGNLWQSIASALSYTETYLMPDDFVPCSLLLRYDGQEAAVLVSFSQTGEDTITATATYVRADVPEDEVAQTYLNLLWERVE
ncbi:MAG: hypothetical protein E7319_05065 [Clostridiales bacterium]|nr:hypothetical protein [Clostridiales bacterium]